MQTFPAPNTVSMESDEGVEFDGRVFAGFYVSYNDVDIGIYGSDTTALVLGQMQRFFILDGDHREEYREAFVGGFGACYEYFCRHLDQINWVSDRP